MVCCVKPSSWRRSPYETVAAAWSGKGAGSVVVPFSVNVCA